MHVDTEAPCPGSATRWTTGAVISKRVLRPCFDRWKAVSVGVRSGFAESVWFRWRQAEGDTLVSGQVAASLPETWIASAEAASFAEQTIISCINFRTVTFWPFTSPTPSSVFADFAETVTQHIVEVATLPNDQGIEHLDGTRDVTSGVGVTHPQTLPADRVDRGSRNSQ